MGRKATDKESISDEDGLSKKEKSRKEDIIHAYLVSSSLSVEKTIFEMIQLRKQTQRAFNVSIFIYIGIMLANVGILAVSLYLAIEANDSSFRKWFSVFGVIICVFLLVLIFQRNPFEMMRSAYRDWSRLSMIIIGYLRELNLIDADFIQKRMVSSKKTDSDHEELTEFVKMKKTYQQYIDEIEKLIDDLSE